MLSKPSSAGKISEQALTLSKPLLSAAGCRGPRQGELWMQVRKEIKLEVAHSGPVVLITIFQEAQGHSILNLKVSSNPKDSTIAHSLLSGLESEGLYKVILPTTTAPEHQCSLVITCSASRTGSAACPCLNNAPRTKLKATTKKQGSTF